MHSISRGLFICSIATVVAWSVCLLVTTVSPAKAALPIAVPFGEEIGGQTNTVLNGSPDPPFYFILNGCSSRTKQTCLIFIGPPCRFVIVMVVYSTESESF